MFHLTQFFLMFISSVYIIQAMPVVYKGSSPSGDAVITVSSNDPEVVKYFQSKYPTKFDQGTAVARNPGNYVRRSFSLAIPGHAAAGNGRSFVSASSLNPYLSPIFFNPLNLEGIGLNEFEPLNLLKGVEGFPDSRFVGPGQINSVATINDNGRVYSKVKTVSFNNRPKINN